MPFDDDMRAAAVEAVDVAPATYTFVAVTGNTYSPSTGATAAGTSTNHTVTASPPFEYDRSLVDGDIVRRGDCYIVVPASGLTVTPTPSMAVAFGGETWRVMSVTTHRGGTQVIAYEVQLRR